MFKVIVEDSFSGAHQIRNYSGKCENLHGHNWMVKLSLGAEKLDSIGMVIDFQVVKEKLQIVLSNLDHKFLNEVYPFTQINPTSENIAFYIHQKMREYFPAEKFPYLKVEVGETFQTSSIYEE